VEELIVYPEERSYEQSVSTRDNLIWDRLLSITVRDAIEVWRPTLYPRTAKTYIGSLHQLEMHHLLDIDRTLQAFALLNHNAVVDMIKKDLPHAELTRQKFAACYISFTKFLNRRFGRLVPVAVPSREKSSKTFFKVREKVATNAVSLKDAERFIAYLATRSKKHAVLE
jgi:integrase/recombinase XerD